MGPSRQVGRFSVEQALQISFPFNRASSDSLVFATPFLTFACCQVGLQGRPESVVPTQSVMIMWSGPLHLHLSFRVCDSSRAGSVGPVSPPAISASSYGIRVAFPPTSLISRPLPPDSKAWLRQPTTTAVCMFRPRGFSPPRQFPPRASHEFVAPHCQPKVHCVSSDYVHIHRRSCRYGAVFEFPATRFTPLEEFHSSAAAPRHRGRCLPVVTTPSLLRRAVRDSRSRSSSPPATSVKKSRAPFCSAPSRIAIASPPPSSVARAWLQHASTNAAAFKALLR